MTIPVKLYQAAQPGGIPFHFLHERCLTPLEYERHCPKCGVDVPWEETVRGYEQERGKLVPVREEDLAAAAPRTSKEIAVLAAVGEGEVESLRFDRSYFIIPSKAGLKAYAILAEAMAGLGKSLLAKVVIRQKEHLALVRLAGSSLVLVTLFYEEEMREPPEAARLRRVPKPEGAALESMLELLRGLSKEFRPGDYPDEHRKRLEEVLRAGKVKVKGRVQG